MENLDYYSDDYANNPSWYHKFADLFSTCNTKLFTTNQTSYDENCCQNKKSQSKLRRTRCNIIKRNTIIDDQSSTLQGGGGKNKKTRKRKWSIKYKRSINCKRPKGFSQKQYCKYGR